jgi:hypothetical protein
MKHLSLLLTVFFFSVLAQAQEKKSKAAAAQKQQAAPAKNAKAAPPAPSFNSLSNDIAGEAAKKLPPYRPALLADSLVKFSPVLEQGTEALKSPYIIVAPNASDEESYNYFQKMASELGDVKGVRNTLVKNEKGDVLAVAINNPSFTSLFNERKKYIAIKTYAFSSLKALEGSKDPWIQYLNQEKSLTKEIILQNTDYLPKTSEIKEADEKIAP